MPTIFSHAVFAVILGKAGLEQRVAYRLWFLIALCAVLPDADVITRWLGAERGSMFAHRGFTHSIFFAALFGGFIALLVRKYLKTGISFAKLFGLFALAVVSHPLLDMLTDGGPGVALLAPFSNERFFFPWRPVGVSPIGLRFFGGRGLAVILSELFWIWLPALVILIFAGIYRRGRPAAEN